MQNFEYILGFRDVGDRPTIEVNYQRAIAAWKNCCALGNPIEPDQNQWLVIAHKALAAAEETCAVN